MKKFKYQIVTALVLITTVFSTYSCKDEPESIISTVKASFDISENETGVNKSVLFSNTSENASYYIWNFGDGNVSADKNPTHKYELAGEYKISLTAIGNASSDSAFADITVSSDYVTIFEGVGITNVNLFETTWGDLKELYGLDTSKFVKYNESIGYFFIVSYDNEGVAFYLYSDGVAKLYSNAEVFAISVWGSKYNGGTTSKGIGLGSDLTAMVDSYGEAEETRSGANSDYTFTFYSYPSIGIDFLDYDEDMIYEMDIYTVSKSTKSTSIKPEVIREIVHKNRNKE